MKQYYTITDNDNNCQVIATIEKNAQFELNFLLALREHYDAESVEIEWEREPNHNFEIELCALIKQEWDEEPEGYEFTLTPCTVYGSDIEESEKRVYMIEPIEDAHPDELTDEEFMTKAEQQGKIWTLRGFANDFNKELVDFNNFIRII